MFMRLFNHWLIKILTVVLIGVIVWLLIHRSPRIPPDVYPFLASLQPELVTQCQEEGSNISPDAWADLLAIKSVLTESQFKESLQPQFQNLIKQIYKNVPWAELNWGSLDRQTIAKIKRRRSILLGYRYYHPGQYTFPVVGKTWYEDTFGAGREGGKRKHEGTDLFGPEGTPIVSVSSGKVEKLGWNRLGGERVGIRGDDGNYYYYAHLKQISPSLFIGKKVAKGEYIGSMGHTGDALATPDHLHFGIQLPNSQWINPFPFLAVWQQQIRSRS